jgi:hypothetical protein
LEGAIAKAFAATGVQVFLSGRSLKSVQKTDENILSPGGKAGVYELDELVEKAIDRYLTHDITAGTTAALNYRAPSVFLK